MSAIVRRNNNLQPLGFHGDQYLLKVVSVLLGDSSRFIETGTNVASTTNYVARTYAKPCFGCEPAQAIYETALQYTKAFPFVSIFNETSKEFMARLQKDHADLFNHRTVFWLDAHSGGFEWTLPQEIAFFTKHFKSGYILIDDFMVPNNKKFVFGRYKKGKNGICGFGAIHKYINSKYTFYFPAYSVRTSTFHPLVGWGLLQFYENTPHLQLDKLLDVEIKKHISK